MQRACVYLCHGSATWRKVTSSLDQHADVSPRTFSLRNNFISLPSFFVLRLNIYLPYELISSLSAGSIML